MANWLESEEKKKIEDAQERQKAFEKQKYFGNSLNDGLKKFYTFCSRVNILKDDEKLKIEDSSIKGNFYEHIYRSYRDNSQDIIYYEREICFYYGESEKLYLEVTLNEEVDSQWSFKRRISGLYKRLLYSVGIDLEDIIQWEEAKMLTIIKWLLNEQDSFDNLGYSYNNFWSKYLEIHKVPVESLPGKLNTMPIFDINTEMTRLYDRIKLETDFTSEITKWKLGRSKKDKEVQFQNQKNKIRSIYPQFNELGKNIVLLPHFSHKVQLSNFSDILFS